MIFKKTNWDDWHFSPSQFNLYLDNPRNYYNQYILGTPRKESIHLIFGSSIHASSEYWHKNKREKTIKQVCTYFKKDFTKRLNKSRIKDTKNFSELGQFMLSKLLNTWEDIEYNGIEEKLEYKIDGNVVKGIIDYIYIYKGDMFDDGYIIIEDLKTSKDFKSYSKDSVYTTFQLRSYAYAAKQKYNLPVKEVRYRIVTKEKKPKVKVYKIKLEPQWEEKYIEDVRMIIQAIKSNIFPRKYNVSSMWFDDFKSKSWNNNYYKDVNEECL